MSKRIKLLAIVLAVVSVALLVPIIYISKFAYPWADDFIYSAESRQVFLRTGSVFSAIGTAFKSTIDTYFDWQGTYTSCFLMSLEPAVFGIKLYHLGGTIMILSILFSYYYLINVVFNKIYSSSKAVKWCTYLLLVTYTIQGVDGKAEAFTWYNSAVHYTFGHSLFVLFIALMLNHAWNPKDKKKNVIATVFISLLGFLAAGVNNVTVFGGLLFVILFYACFCAYQRVFGDQTYDMFLRSLPMIITYIVGTIINLGAPGNKQRMMTGTNKNGLLIVIRNSFALGIAFIQRHFSWVTFGFMILIAAIIWYSINSEKMLKDTTFKFSLPLFITLISFCLLSALYAPFAYLSDAEISAPYIDGNLDVARVSNTIFYVFVLLLFFNVFYYCGWAYQKGLHKYSAKLGVMAAIVAIIIVVFNCKQILNENPSKFTTASAVYSLKNGTALYYGNQMTENIIRLESDEDVVYVSPIGVDPDCLYPHDAEDWKDGTRLFFNKEEVVYDSEPYDF